jgi:hypothetical protein
VRTWLSALGVIVLHGFVFLFAIFGTIAAAYGAFPDRIQSTDQMYLAGNGVHIATYGPLVSLLVTSLAAIIAAVFGWRHAWIIAGCGILLTALLWLVGVASFTTPPPQVGG